MSASALVGAASQYSHCARPHGRSAARVDAALQAQVSRHVEIETDAIVLRPCAGLHAEAHSVVDGLRAPTRGRRSNSSSTLRLSTPSDLRILSKASPLARSASRRRWRVAAPGRRRGCPTASGRGCAKGSRPAAARDRSERECRLVGRTGDVDIGGDVGRRRLREQIEFRHDVAVELRAAAGELELTAEHVQRAAPQVEAALDLRICGCARDLEFAAEFGVDAAAAQKTWLAAAMVTDSVAVERRGRLGAAGLCAPPARGERARSGRDRLARARQRAGPLEIARNLMSIECRSTRPADPESRASAPREFDREIGARGDDVVGDQLRALPVSFSEPGKPAAGSSLTRPAPACRRSGRGVKARDIDLVAVGRDLGLDRLDSDAVRFVGECRRPDLRRARGAGCAKSRDRGVDDDGAARALAAGAEQPLAAARSSRPVARARARRPRSAAREPVTRSEPADEAFPLVLKKEPQAKLVVAGANHHTKPGYWESIRAGQPSSLPIEFRGYVPEDDIPELYQTSSVVALPYDSATGSSGPAHQACEYGVPIVSARLQDFELMAANENMAIRFYKVGDSADLANQLLAILQSPQLEHEMAEQNFAAGLEMTMTSIIQNYLRWFELKQLKRDIASEEGSLVRWRRRSTSVSARVASPDLNARSLRLAPGQEVSNRSEIPLD